MSNGCVPIGSYKPGAAGRSLKGVEIKIDKPDSEGDGEICFRGRHVFMGYLYQAEKTAECVDEDGWLHSGDIGRIDDDGTVAIVHRVTGFSHGILALFKVTQKSGQSPCTGLLAKFCQKSLIEFFHFYNFFCCIYMCLSCVESLS